MCCPDFPLSLVSSASWLASLIWKEAVTLRTQKRRLEEDLALAQAPQHCQSTEQYGSPMLLRDRCPEIGALGWCESWLKLIHHIDMMSGECSGMAPTLHGAVHRHESRFAHSDS